MSSLIESTDYDNFEYKHFDEPALLLDDAIKMTAKLRTSDPAHFHRIVPADSDMTSFRVESVSRDVGYARLVSRWNELLNRFVSKGPVKR
jgi:hypothetical protein